MASMPGPDKARRVGQCVRSVSVLAEAEDTPVCWICLDGPHLERPLMHPCKCPSFCHATCIARWQLQSAGTRRERFCDFCAAELPDWKGVLTPGSGSTAPAVMNVNFDGKTYSFQVAPGPDGYRQFTEAIRRAFSLPDDSELNITFTCDEPSSGSLLTLSGPGAYDAAVHCASVSAARRSLSGEEEPPSQSSSGPAPLLTPTPGGGGGGGREGDAPALLPPPLLSRGGVAAAAGGDDAGDDDTAAAAMAPAVVQRRQQQLPLPPALSGGAGSSSGASSSSSSSFGASHADSDGSAGGCGCSSSTSSASSDGAAAAPAAADGARPAPASRAPLSIALPHDALASDVDSDDAPGGAADAYRRHRFAGPSDDGSDDDDSDGLGSVRGASPGTPPRGAVLPHAPSSGASSPAGSVASGSGGGGGGGSGRRTSSSGGGGSGGSSSGIGRKLRDALSDLLVSR